MTEQGYETVVWRGQTRYRCDRRWESGAPCEYDTHSLADMAAHVRTPHSREVNAKVPTAPAVEAPPVVDEVPEALKNVRFAEE